MGGKGFGGIWVCVHGVNGGLGVPKWGKTQETHGREKERERKEFSRGAAAAIATACKWRGPEGGRV